MKKLSSFLLLLVLACTSFSSFAVKRGDPLEGQPAVRKRILYLPGRFELRPSLGVSFLQDYKHSFLFGINAEYHLNDYLSAGFSFHYSLFEMNSALTDEIQSTLPAQLEDDTYINPTPSKDAMMDALDSIEMVFGPHIAYTPAFGKMGLFGSVFFDFDLYFFAGVGIVKLKGGNLDKYTDDPNNAPQEEMLHLQIEENNGGLTYGPQAGFGVHVFLNRWIALNMNFRWLYIKRNSAGFDTNGDRMTGNEGNEWVIIDEKDKMWENTMFFHFGVSMFFPRWAPRSK
ncbi:MAG: outer membrane beta-barrel domain-containing protein [Myxococcota bacterium]